MIKNNKINIFNKYIMYIKLTMKIDMVLIIINSILQNNLIKIK